MNRVGKQPHSRRQITADAPVIAKRRGGVRAWGSVALLSLLLVGGFGALVLPDPVRVPDSLGAAAGQGDNSSTNPSAAPADTKLNAEASPDDAGVAGWVAVNSDAPSFRLEPLPQVPGALALRPLMARPGAVEGVRHISGGGRDDALTIGEAGEPGPLLRLSLYRPGTEPQPGGSYFVDVARRAGEHGMSVVRFVPLPPVESAIGALDIALARFEGVAGARNCVTFRRGQSEPAVRLSGWICLDADQAPAPEAAACLVDAVRWQAGDEAAMTQLFSARPGATSACATPAPSEMTSSVRPAGDGPSVKGGRR